MGGLWTGARPVHIAAASKMVSDYSGMIVQPHKVGSCVVMRGYACVCVCGGGGEGAAVGCGQGSPQGGQLCVVCVRGSWV